MDILKMGVWNELRVALDKWNEMNDSLNRGETKYTKGDHDSLRQKINALERQLSNIIEKEKAS